MKFLLYGAQGWIGQQMDTLLAQVEGSQIVHGRARADDEDAVAYELDQVEPDRVFCSIGRTHGVTEDGVVYNTIDFLELPGGAQLNTRDNFNAPLTLAKLCLERDIHFTYLGTGCIFEYDDDVHRMPEYVENQEEPIDCSNVCGFTEDDRPNFFGSGYSLVKGCTDVAMQTLSQLAGSDQSGVLNLRIRMPITLERHPRDFITKITGYRQICSVPNSMTVLPQILPIIALLMTRGESGTYNMCNPGVMSHNQILNMYAKYVDQSFEYRNFSPEQQAQILLSGRSNNYLDTTKLEEFCKQNDVKLDPLYVAVKNVLLASVGDDVSE